jgi:hypothetical protein
MLKSAWSLQPTTLNLWQAYLPFYTINGTAIGLYRQIAERPGFIQFHKTL